MTAPSTTAPSLATTPASPARTPRPEVEVERLITSNLVLVGHIARETAARLPRHLGTDDLTGAGAVALVQAARAFDPGLGVPFARFASVRIRGAMIDFMRSRDWATRSLRSRARALEEVREELTKTLHREPSDVELAGVSGLSEADVREIRSGTDRAVLLSLDPANPDESGIGAMLEDAAPRPEDALLAAERMGYLRDAIAELPERTRRVVSAYYLDGIPLTEIAEELGVTQSRCSQLRAEGLDLLKEALTILLHPEARAARPAADTDAGVRARRRASYVQRVAQRTPVHRRADVSAYLAGATLGRG